MRALYWGFNGHGQLGPASPGRQSIPLDLGLEVCAASCSWSSIILVSQSGLLATILGFLNGKAEQRFETRLPNEDTFKQVVSCGERVLSVSVEGRVWELLDSLWHPISLPASEGLVDHVACMGKTILVLSEGRVINLSLKCIVLVPSKVVNIACGEDHRAALTDTGEVYTWGSSTRGQLGHGSLESLETPTRVEALGGLEVIQIACGVWHSAAVTRDGDLYCWGWNHDGQLGVPSPPLFHTSKESSEEEEEETVSVQACPTPVNLPLGVRQVACGARHTLVLTDDGLVWGCGWAAHGQLGVQKGQQVSAMTPVVLPPNTRGQLVTAGGWGSMLLTAQESITTN